MTAVAGIITWKGKSHRNSPVDKKTTGMSLS